MGLGWGFTRRLSFELGIDAEMAERIEAFVDSSPEYWNQDQMCGVENQFDKELEIAENTIDSLHDEVDRLLRYISGRRV